MALPAECHELQLGAALSLILPRAFLNVCTYPLSLPFIKYSGTLRRRVRCALIKGTGSLGSSRMNYGASLMLTEKQGDFSDKSTWKVVSALHAPRLASLSGPNFTFPFPLQLTLQSVSLFPLTGSVRKKSFLLPTN